MSQTKAELIKGFGISSSAPEGSVNLDSSGRLGIGTSSPSALLHVSSTGAVESLLSGGGTSGDTVLHLKGNGNAYKFIVPNTAAQYGMGLYDVGNAAYRLFVNSSGNVGIGTTSPGAPLSVNGNAIIGPESGTRLAVNLTENDKVELQIVDSTSTARALALTVGTTEAARIDSSGRLLVGTASARSNFAGNTTTPLVQIEGITASTASSSVVRGAADATGPTFNLGKTRGASVGQHTVVASGDQCGVITFQGADGTNLIRAAQIAAEVDGTPGANDMPGRLVFSTTADGASSPTERMRIASGGRVSAPSWYDETTAGAANVNVASTGILQRSTSSIKYKTDVETIEDSYSDALLNCRPVWYRSTCANDNPNYGWWGFIAEEVAEIDPRLCFFEQKEDGSLEPEGVAYDRFVPHLLNLIKRQGEAIAELQAEVAALKAA